MLGRAFLFISTLTLSTTNYAAINSWSSVGPDGGDVNAIAFDPTTSTTAYAATTGGVFKTTDDGLNWTRVEASTTYDVAITSDGNQIFSGGFGDARTSTDGGVTWTEMNVPLSSSIESISVSGQSILARNVWDDLAYSTDLGNSFTEITNFTLSTSVNDALLDPSNSNRLFIVSYDGIFYSNDTGTSWNTATVPAGFTSAFQIAADPVSTTTFYAITSAGILKSTDSGVTWSSVLSTTFAKRENGIAVDPKDNNIIYVSNIYGGTLYRSTDAGANWSAINTIDANTIAVHPSTANKLLLGNATNLFASTDSGANWSSLSTGLVATRPSLLSVHPSTGDIFVGGITGQGLFRGNGDSALTSVAGGLNAEPVYGIAFDPSDNDTLYAAGTGTSGGVYKSTDNGSNWSTANNSLSHVEILSLAISPLDADFLITGGEMSNAQNLNSSSNAAVSWQQPAGTFFDNLNIEAIAIDPNNDNVIYIAASGVAGSGASVYKSVDRGVSWTDTGARDTIRSRIETITINPHDSNDVRLLSGSAMYQSTDAGANWGDLNYPGPDEDQGIAFHPSDSSTFYIGNYQTTDNGTSWCEIATGLPEWMRIEGNAIDPSDPNKLYIRTRFYGVYSIELNREAPTANAGTDFTHTDTGLTISLEGSATDNAGCIVSYSWNQISGPAMTTAPTNVASTTFVPAANGEYVFELTVTDQDGDTDTDRITVTVQSSTLNTSSSSGGGGGAVSYLFAFIYLFILLLGRRSKISR